MDTAFPKDWINSRIFQNKMYEFVRQGLVDFKIENSYTLIKGGNPLTEEAHKYLFDEESRKDLHKFRQNELASYREEIKHYENLVTNTNDFEERNYYRDKVDYAARQLDAKFEQIEKEEESFFQLDEIYGVNQPAEEAATITNAVEIEKPVNPILRKPLLLPITLDLTRTELETFHQIETELDRIGYESLHLGERVIAIKTIPESVSSQEIEIKRNFLGFINNPESISTEEKTVAETEAAQAILTKLAQESENYIDFRAKVEKETLNQLSNNMANGRAFAQSTSKILQIDSETNFDLVETRYELYFDEVKKNLANPPVITSENTSEAPDQIAASAMATVEDGLRNEILEPDNTPEILKNIEEIQFGNNPELDFGLIKNNKLNGSYNFQVHALNVAFNDAYETYAQKSEGATFYYDNKTITILGSDESGMYLALKSAGKVKNFTGYSFNRLIQEDLIDKDTFKKVIQAGDLKEQLTTELKNNGQKNTVLISNKSIENETILLVQSNNSAGNYVIIKDSNQPDAKIELYKETGDGSPSEKFYAKNNFALNIFSDFKEVSGHIKNSEALLEQNALLEKEKAIQVDSEAILENELSDFNEEIEQDFASTEKIENGKEKPEISNSLGNSSIKTIEETLETNLNNFFTEKGYDFSLRVKASDDERDAFDVFYQSAFNDHQYPKYRLYKPTPEFEEWCALKNRYNPPKNILTKDFEITDKSFETEKQMTDFLIKRVIRDENLKVNLENLTPTVLQSTEQTGRIERRIAKILHAHNIAEEIASNKDFAVILKNEPYEDLHITKGADGLIRLTHYYVQNGDLMHDGEMNFKLEKGILSLNQTAAALYGIPSYSYDRSFANTFSTNLMHQGFDKAKLVRFADLIEENEITEAKTTVTTPKAQNIEEPIGVKKGTIALAEEIREKLQNGEEIGNNIEFNKMAQRAFGGTRASGTFSSKDAYDALELGLNLYLIEKVEKENLFENPSNTLSELRDIIKKLPRQADRTDEQIQFQQFSTPPTEAFVSVVAANLQPNDVVLEPSAGNGGLALWSKGQKIQTFVNELSNRRAGILKLLGFDEVSRKDAQFLNDTLDDHIQPTVIIMNPPFSASGGRAKNNTKVGAEHLTDALARLKDNGRVVAILGEGMNFESQKFNGWWKEVMNKYNVRANLGIPGEEYSKFGTTFGNQLIVIDKTGRTPGNTYEEQLENVVHGQFNNLEEILEQTIKIKETRQINQDFSEKQKSEVKNLGIEKIVINNSESEEIEDNREFTDVKSFDDFLAQTSKPENPDLYYKTKFTVLLTDGRTFSDQIDLQKNEDNSLLKSLNDELASLQTLYKMAEEDPSFLNEKELAVFDKRKAKAEDLLQIVNTNQISPKVNQENTKEDFTKIYDQARWDAIGAVTGAIVERIEKRGYRVIYGKVEPKSDLKYDIAGIVGPGTDRFIEKGLSIEKVRFHNIEYAEHITRKDLQNNPEKIYLFGDNLKQTGYGGQAKEMRGEPNAIGIPTKKSPSNENWAFFNDKDFDNNKEAIDKSIAKLAKYPPDTVIVIPSAGLGTGLADLENKAPKTFKYLNERLGETGVSPENTGIKKYSRTSESLNQYPDTQETVNQKVTDLMKLPFEERVLEINNPSVYIALFASNALEENKISGMDSNRIKNNVSKIVLNNVSEMLANDILSLTKEDFVDKLEILRDGEQIYFFDPAKNSAINENLDTKQDSYPEIDLDAYWKAQSNNPDYYDGEDNFPPEQVRDDYFNETFVLANSILDLTEKTRVTPTTVKNKNELAKNLNTLEIQKDSLAFHVVQIGNFFGQKSQEFVQKELETNDIYLTDDSEIKVYQLSAGVRGNGKTIWNRAEIVNNDYKNIAHIGDDGKISFFGNEKLPEKILKEIENWGLTKEVSSENKEINNDNSKTNNRNGMERNPGNSNRLDGIQPGLYDRTNQPNESHAGNDTKSSDLLSDEHKSGRSNENAPARKTRTSLLSFNSEQSILNENGKDGIRQSDQGNSLAGEQQLTEQTEPTKSLTDIIESGKNTERRANLENLGVVEYKPAKLKGGVQHPGDIVESTSMAAVEPPDITYTPKLDPTVIEEGKLSSLQYEVVCYAGMRHNHLLPDGSRAGFFIGDGTGVGKGREIAGIALDNWNQGRKKILWLSINYDLVPSAERDLKDLGASDIQLKTLDKISVHDSLDEKAGDAILFSSYSTLTAKGKDGTTRFDQIVKWLGEDGVIIFDEGHLAKNAIGFDKNSSSQRGEAVLNLQTGEKSNPNWRFVYSSATGATEPRNMAYMQRLGLWGQGTGFPTGFPEFLNTIENGGLGAMELVSRDTKAMGMYLSRSLSYRGVDYRTVEHTLTPEQREIYNLSAQCWSEAMRSFEEALRTTGAPGNAKRFAYAQLFSSQQLFYKQLMTALKVPALIQEVEKIIKDGSVYTDSKTGQQYNVPAQVVIGIIGTGEARTKEQMAKAREFGLDLDSLDFSPKQILMNVVAKSFPTDRYKTKTDPVSGNEVCVLATDEHGRALKNKEAEKLRDELLTSLEEKLILPDNPLDQIIQYFGENRVSEITGRDKRIVIDSEGRKKYVKRAREGVAMDKASQDEMDSFQSGRKPIAVISQSASTGISLHSELKPLLEKYIEEGRLTNIQSTNILDYWNKHQDTPGTLQLLDENGVEAFRRVHVTLETAWSADTQMQTFGRTHRSNELLPPEYVLMSVDLGGEKRFLSTIAKRLSSLGALTKGDREQAGGNLLNFDFENHYGLTAARSILMGLESNSVNLISKLPTNPYSQKEPDGMDILYTMGLAKLTNGQKYLPDEVLKNLEVSRFLNRLLVLDVDTQNAIFEAFADKIEGYIEQDKANGMFDAGVTELDGKNIRLADEPKLVSTDQATGAKTFYSRILTDTETKPLTLEQIAERNKVIRIGGVEITNNKAAGTFYQQTNSKNIVYVEFKTQRTDEETGGLTRMYQFARPSGWGDHLLSEKDLLDKYVPVRLDEIRDFGKDKEPMKISDWWNQEVENAPKTKTNEHHLITGAVLPVFNRLKSTSDKGDTINLKTIRTETEDGERIIGVNIPSRQISRVLRDLGIQQSIQTPEEVYKALTNLKEDVELVGGINLKSTFFKQQPAIEIRNLSIFQKVEFQNFGAIKEIANYADRYFVPTDEIKGVEALTKILKQYPAVKVEENEANDKVPALQNKFGDPKNLFYQRVESLKELELKEFADRIEVQTNEKGQIELSEGSFEVINRAYQKAFNEEFPKIDGTFAENHRAQLIKSSLDEMITENPDSAEKLQSIKEAIENSEEIRGERGIIFLVNPEAAIHEEVHASSNQARFGKDLVEGHARFEELVDSESYQISKPILSEKYETDNDGLLVEETFAYAASGEGHEIGLTPEQSADFVELWFTSVYEKNPEKMDEILEYFKEISDESKQSRDNAYNQIREERSIERGKSLGESAGDSDSLPERKSEGIDYQTAVGKGFDENDEFIISDHELGEIYESLSIEHKFNELTDPQILADYLKKYPNVSGELIDFAASRDFGIIKDTTEYGKILDEKGVTEQSDALAGITKKLTRQVSEINEVDYESILNSRESDTDLVDTYYPYDEYEDISNGFGENFHKITTEVHQELSTALAKEIISRSNLKDAEFEVKELLTSKNKRKYLASEDKNAKPISLKSLDIEANKFAQTAVNEMWKNGAIVEKAKAEKQSPKEISNRLKDEAISYKKELQQPQRNAIEKAYNEEVENKMRAIDDLTEIHEEKTASLNVLTKEITDDVKVIPALSSKQIWQLQEKAVKRGDLEMFTELETFNRQLEVPRTEEASAKLYGLKELVETKAKTSAISNVEDDSKIRLTISNKEGKLEIKEITLEETNQEIDEQKNKIANIKYPGLRDFTHPFISQINPLSPINGTLSWFTNPLQTAHSHLSPIQQIKNCPHAQIIKALYKTVNAGIDYIDASAELKELEKVKTRLEEIKETKLAENAKLSLDNYKLQDAIEESLKADSDLLKEKGLEQTEKTAFKKVDLEEIREKAEFAKNGEILEKYSNIAQKSTLENSIERTAARAVISDVELASDSFQAFEKVVELEEGVIEVELSTAQVAKAFNSLEYAEKANSLAEKICPQDCNYRFTGDQVESLSKSISTLDGETGVGVNEILNPINDVISENVLAEDELELNQFINNASIIPQPIGTAGNLTTDSQVEQMMAETFQNSAFDAMATNQTPDYSNPQDFSVQPEASPMQNFTQENSLAKMEDERQNAFQKMRESMEGNLSKKSNQDYEEHLEELETAEIEAVEAAEAVEAVEIIAAV